MLTAAAIALAAHTPVVVHDFRERSPLTSVANAPVAVPGTRATPRDDQRLLAALDALTWARNARDCQSGCDAVGECDWRETRSAAARGWPAWPIATFTGVRATGDGAPPRRGDALNGRT